MKKKSFWILHPFEKIAGWTALWWGMAAFAVCTLLCCYAGYHFHGLLHYGPAPNNAWWMYLIEHLVVWLIPAALFLLGGLLFSKSAIRFVDVLGTVAFAQVAFIPMILFALLPPMQRLMELDADMSITDIMALDTFAGDSAFAMLSTIFLVWLFIWMFNALKVSCNLKTWKLHLVFWVSMFGGDAICRLIISPFY